LASRELHCERIFVSFWGIFWYCIIVIIIIINSYSLSCCCSLNCLELFVSIWYFLVCKAWPFDVRTIFRILWWLDKQNLMGPCTKW
jgi:hypothetical protein